MHVVTRLIPDVEPFHAEPAQDRVLDDLVSSGPDVDASCRVGRPVDEGEPFALLPMLLRLLVGLVLGPERRHSLLKLGCPITLLGLLYHCTASRRPGFVFSQATQQQGEFHRKAFPSRLPGRGRPNHSTTKGEGRDRDFPAPSGSGPIEPGSGDPQSPRITTTPSRPLFDTIRLTIKAFGRRVIARGNSRKPPSRCRRRGE